MLSVLTLNVWFAKLLMHDRTQALIRLIQVEKPHVVCLQEVVPYVADSLIAAFPTWGHSGFEGFAVNHGYGVLIMTRPDLAASFTSYELESRMGRKLVVAKLPDLAVGSVHLESLNNHKWRVRQLQRCAQVLAGFSDALLVGDFNFDSTRNFKPPHVPLENDDLNTSLPDFDDVWPKLRPKELGLTYDSQTNPYIRKTETMRYDRVMARLKLWVANSIQLIGSVGEGDSDAQRIFLSDHFGVLAHFARPLSPHAMPWHPQVSRHT
uniref:Endonuclease/exonuclease/phosphatase domain-containing protein n=1 Tax=Zooxanthella nutricula TaxID=1333877 RepID=A0A6U6J7J3_9DINO|mmetsp:Transcript_22110/g.66057  ORF Transcript_22110/g.66057 Transcript_22110/m.66057 type:complete len:265 (+) Transcript_22110:88-882(+)